MAGERCIFLRYVSGTSSSSRLLRGIIPLILVAILLDNILEDVLSKFIKINIPVLLSLITIVLMAVTVILAIRIARFIFRSAEIAEAERHKAVLALKESENKYRLIIENQGEGIGLVDTEERFVYVNPAAERIFGVKPGALVNRNLMEFLAPEYVQAVLDETRKRSRAEHSSYEVEILTPDKVTRVILVTASPQFDEQGLFLGTFGVFRDLSERKKVEKSLKESEERFRKLAETAADGILSIDSEGVIRLFNHAAEQIFGFLSDEVIGKKVELIIPREYGDLHMKGIRQYSETGISTVLGKTTEMKAKRRDGTIFPIELSLSEVKVGDETTFIGMIRDISERKLAEARLADFNEELKELNATKDKFFSIIAHDLKNPFNLLLGFSRMLIEEIEHLKFNEALEISRRINSVSSSTYSLLENLLTWSQVQTRNIHYQKEAFILGELLAPELKLLSALAAQKNISLVNNIRNSMEMNADKNMIGTVIRNLVNNAIKFTRKGGIITLTSLEGDHEITICVSDTGTGMSKVEVSKLFNVSKGFSKTGTAMEKGTGLGLILCKEFIALHGGTIVVESEPDKGSRFSFTLPA
jgi:PAS domain S-box-containing protein